MVGWRASTNCMLWVIGNFCNAIRLLSVREGFPACALWSARTMSRSTSADVMMVQTKLIFFIDLPSSRDELSLNRLFLYSQECTSDAGVLSVNLSALWNSRMEFAFFFSQRSCGNSNPNAEALTWYRCQIYWKCRRSVLAFCTQLNRPWGKKVFLNRLLRS